MAGLTRQLLLASVAWGVLASAASAEEGLFDNWDINGYNTVRGDLYDIDGNTFASPYPFGGFHSYNEFSINASRQYSPYERLNINFLGLINGSDYRNTDDGFVPERIQIMYENGEASVPYRATAGDFFAGISYRTLQRTLKGASVELQPFSTREQRHSILFFSGTNEPTYRSFDADDDFYTGASWLVEDVHWGRASFNVIRAYQDDTTFTLPGTDNTQMIYSGTVETPFTVLSQDMTFEGELAFFDGDYALLNDQNDVGAFAQLAGRSRTMPLDYRLRYERYGTDYRPNGAIITPDRRSYEAHAGWRFDWGPYLRGRIQRFEDSFDSTNEQTTDLVGVNLSGPLLTDFVTGLTGNIDVYQQQIDNAFNTVDRDTDTLNASFNMPVYQDWSGQLTLFVQNMDDRLATDFDMTTRQLGLGVFAPFSLFDMSGTINPGFVLREINANSVSDSNDINPTLNLTLANESHRINANYNILSQNRIAGTATDVVTQTTGVEYAYTFGDHEVGLNAAYYDRDVDAAIDTDAWRAGLYWTMRFNKPASSSARAVGAERNAIAGTAGTSVPALQLAGLSLMSDLQPGSSLTRATTLLAEEGITGSSDRSGLKIYEAALIKEVVERQRVALEHRNNNLTKAGLIIDVTDTGSPRSVEQLYERVKQLLVRQYGNPDNIVEEGEFTGNVMDDITNERIVRVIEWETPNGTIRYGLPRRLDGQVRLELQHAKRFEGARNALWSMKNVY